jgi:SHS2 domain-containing protein
MYELFDHTADVGLRVTAPDLPRLFCEAAEGLFSVIVEEIPRGVSSRRLDFRLEAERAEFLLVDWLSELLYVFDTRRLLLDAFEVDLRGNGLTAAALARPLDENRDRLLREVKAVTYHGLRLEPTASGWLAEVILDI